MLSSENDDFKFLKNLRKTEKNTHLYHVHHSYRARRAGLFLQTSLSFARNMNVKVAIQEMNSIFGMFIESCENETCFMFI